MGSRPGSAEGILSRHIADHAEWIDKRRQLYHLKLAFIEHYAGKVGDRVRAGPFAGLHLPVTGHWGGGDLVSKVFGFSERQLHGFWYEAFAREYAVFLDVGCADGFYATGFALRNPRTHCDGFDRDAQALASAVRQVRANALGNCEVRALFDATSIPAIRAEQGLSPSARLLLKCDVEGAELELFSEELCRDLCHADVLVEIHDLHDDTRIEDALRANLAATHRIEIIGECARDPNEHAFLRSLPEDVRWLVLSESRWSAMRWMLARSLALSR